jgi:signal transduction histidine kinase
MFSDLFPAPLVPIYFVYGLAFFTLGLAVTLESGRTAIIGLPFARAMVPLGMFGLLHGLHEWLEMFIRDAELHGLTSAPLGIEAVRVILLALSFGALLAFGIKMLQPPEWPVRLAFYAAGGVLLFWASALLVLGETVRAGDAMRLTLESWLLMGDTLSRYMLAIPGALLSGYGLWQQARCVGPERRRFATDLRIAAAAFVLYGAIGQFFVSQTYLFPSNIINAALFERLTGAPIQLFRALMAGVFALTMIHALHMLELERQQELAAAQQRARDELAKREALRREMLVHTVAAQEEERRRIARELHDEIGQTLTALSLGVGGLANVAGDAARLSERIEDLRRLAADGVAQLHHLVTDLRPSQLDHLGLAAALRSLVEEYQARFGLAVDFKIDGHRRRLPPEVELAVFRIAQEALTNVVRHAGVTAAEVRLDFAPDGVELCICDHGVGFLLDATSGRNHHWGLLGMTERATQLGGSVTIDTAPGRGTRVIARLPEKDESGVRGERREDQNPPG